MKRDTLITILLVIAGLVLAIVLFGAGALWKGKSTGMQGRADMAVRDPIIPVSS